MGIAKCGITPNGNDRVKQDVEQSAASEESLTEIDFSKVTAAANEIMRALEPLSAHERERAIKSAAALYDIAAMTAASPNPTETTRDPGRVSASGGKRLSIVEFIKEKEAATNAQRIACFAYYREHIEAAGTNFSMADLRPYFGQAKIADPKQYNRDFSKAVSEGWIHEAGASSYLTQGGESAVENGFGGKTKPRGRHAGKRKRKVNKTTSGE